MTNNLNKELMILIPLHEMTEEVKTLLPKAINSVDTTFQIVISTIPSLLSEAREFLDAGGDKWQNVSAVANVKDDGDSSFSSLVNAGVDDDFEWFSILEFDDTYNNMFDEFFKYKKFKKDVSVFMTLESLMNYNTSHFVGYGNEAPWASSFSSEIGTIDNESLQQFFDFYLTGSYFKTSDWKTVGGLKPSIQVSFWYEFLLRLTKQNKKVFVIPKVGYYHTVNRPNSLMEIYRSTIDAKESQWWFELAQKECGYKIDRKKEYVKKD